MLEQYYGTVLFDRVNRNITLTAAGELLQKYALEMNIQQYKLEKEMQELTGTIKGRLLIGASTTIGEYVLPYLVGKFKKDYPEVSVSLQVANTEEIERDVMDTSLDVGLVEGPVSGKDLVINKFLDDELVLIVPPEHPWSSREKVSIYELGNYPFITREKGSGTRHIIEQILEETGFPVENLHIIMELGSTTSIKAAVSNGLGISVISRWAAIDSIIQKRVAEVAIEETKFRRQFIVIHHEKKFRTQAVQEFINYLLKTELSKFQKGQY